MNNYECVIDELKKQVDEERCLRLQLGSVCEQWEEGNQVSLIESSNVLNLISLLPPGTQYRPYNYLGNICKTFVSRITAASPRVKAYPLTEEARRVGAAQVSNRLLEYTYRKNNFDELLSNVVRFATVHGTAGISIDYDKEKNDVIFKLRTIFDYIIDDVPDNPQWVIFLDYVDEYEARKMAPESANINVGPYPAQGMGIEVPRSYANKQVALVETLFYLPCARYEQGKYIRRVGGIVVDEADYPYLDPEDNPIFPFAHMVISKRRMSHYGDTWVNDCINVQATINMEMAQLAKLKRNAASPLLMLPQSVQNSFNPQGGILFLGPNIDAGQIGWTSAPPVPAVLAASLPLQKTALFDIAGVNELSTGVDQARAGDSAKKIGYLAGLDANKHAATAKSMHSMVKDLMSAALKMYQSFCNGKDIGVFSPDNEYRTYSFLNADIAGTDVILEEISGESMRRPEMADEEKELVKQGIKSAVGLEEQIQTGLPDSALELAYTRHTEEILKAIAQGYDAQPDPSLPTDIVQQAVDNFIAEHDLDPEQLAAVQAFLAQYKQPEEAVE